MRLLIDEFRDGIRDITENSGDKLSQIRREFSIATGKLVFPCIMDMANEVMSLAPGIKIHVYEIINEFFGERITVSGLLTGRDIIGQLKGRELGDFLYLPENLLRSGEDYLLDDVTVGDIEKALGTKIRIAPDGGFLLAHALFGLD